MACAQEEENSQLRCVVQMPQQKEAASLTDHIYLAYKASKKKRQTGESRAKTIEVYIYGVGARLITRFADAIAINSF